MSQSASTYLGFLRGRLSLVPIFQRLLESTEDPRSLVGAGLVQYLLNHGDLPGLEEHPRSTQPERLRGNLLKPQIMEQTNELNKYNTPIYYIDRHPMKIFMKN